MTNYEIKKIPEDFKVSEVIDFSRIPCKNGNYHYYYVSKLGLTTFQAIELIAKYSSLPPGSIGYSGLKDEDGVTGQYISLPKFLDDTFINEFNTIYAKNNLFFLTLKYFGAGDEPFKVAKLQGNCFQLKIRNLSEQINFNIEASKEYNLSFVNYYGSQRFGLPNQIKNTHLIGKAMIEKNYSLALKEISKQDSRDGNLAKNFTGCPEKFFEGMEPRTIAFFQSAYYSSLWNNEISNYISQHKWPYRNKLLDGINFQFLQKESDILNLLKYQPMLTNIRIIFEENRFKEVVHNRSTVIQTKIFVENILEDELNPGMYYCQLSFYLPSGCYATMAVPQFMQKFLFFHEAVYA